MNQFKALRRFYHTGCMIKPNARANRMPISIVNPHGDNVTYTCSEDECRRLTFVINRNGCTTTIEKPSACLVIANKHTDKIVGFHINGHTYHASITQLIRVGFRKGEAEMSEQKNPQEEVDVIKPVEETKRPSMTRGQYLVGLDFNPFVNGDVEEFKLAYALLLDMLIDLREQATCPEIKRTYSLAITETQSACMWAVKGVTQKPFEGE